MSSALSITRAVNPPRAAFLDYPLGHTTGKPGDRAVQRAILREALSAFEWLDTPGSILELPFAWSDDDAWKDKVMRDGGSTGSRDERVARLDTPQYQNAHDRELAEHGPCPGCVWPQEKAPRS